MFLVPKVVVEEGDDGENDAAKAEAAIDMEIDAVEILEEGDKFDFNCNLLTNSSFNKNDLGFF